MQKEYKTKAKDYILEYIKNNKERRFSVNDIQEYLIENDININLTTIYGNLDKLSLNGILLKFKNTKEDFNVYQYNEPGAGCHEHLHIECSKCGKILHIDDEVMKDFNEHLRLKYNFYLDCENSSLQGLCISCACEK